MNAPPGGSRISDSSIGSMNFHVLRALIDEYDVLKLGRGAEIGVLAGDTSHYLLKSFPTLALIGVDPFMPYEEVQDERNHQTMMVYQAVARHRYAMFGQRGSLMEMSSLDAARLIPDGSLDFVFIDALHTYQAVKEDIAAWVPKVRVGGLIAGHDISWEDVARAVEEYAVNSDVNISRTPEQSDIWFTFKGTEENPRVTPAPSCHITRFQAIQEVARASGLTVSM